MAFLLAPLDTRIAIHSSHIAEEPTTLRVKQANHQCSGGDFTISALPSDDPKGPAQPLFSMSGKAISWSQRCIFSDASGTAMFNLSRETCGLTWVVNSAGQRGKKRLARLQPKRTGLRDKMDVVIVNEADQGKEIVLEVRGHDGYRLTTDVYLGDQVVMSTKVLKWTEIYNPLKNPEWEVAVARGMDLSLAAVITTVLAMRIYENNWFASGSKPTKTLEKGVGGSSSR